MVSSKVGQEALILGPHTDKAHRHLVNISARQADIYYLHNSFAERGEL